MPTPQQRFAGCLLGGAVGDALGAPVEFMTRREILSRFGPDGITEYAPAYGGLGTITDDTQMTLFTAEGLLRAWVRHCYKGITTYSGVTAHAYLRWLLTQGVRPTCELSGHERNPGWLFQQRQLHHRRAPGNTCLSALGTMPHFGAPATNDSKGCGGVMRVAPVGLFAWRLHGRESLQETFDVATEIAALTHGHPTGSLTAGVLAVLIQLLTDGATMHESLTSATVLLQDYPDHAETLHALQLAQDLAATDLPPIDVITRLGQGWIAEEALAISVYCALVATDFRSAITMAVNHDGDSDSTGAITGNLLGAMHGIEVIPPKWQEPLELRDVITELATDLCEFADWDIGDYDEETEQSRRIWERYPGY